MMAYMLLLLVVQALVAVADENQQGGGSQFGQVFCNAIEVQDRVLQIGFDLDEFLPFKIHLHEETPYTNHNDQNSGFDASYARMLASIIVVSGERIPIEARFAPQTTDSFERDMFGPLHYPSRYDVAFSALSSSQNREQEFDIRFMNYTDDVPTRVVVSNEKSREEWAKYSDLCGKSIGFSAGTIYEVYVVVEIDKICLSRGLPPVDGVPALRRDVQAMLVRGSIDAYVDGIGQINDFLAENPGQFYDAPVGCPYTTIPGADTGGLFVDTIQMGAAVRSSSTDLLDCLERAQAKLEDNGKTEQLRELWLSGSDVFDYITCMDPSSAAMQGSGGDLISL